jgi:hypothetical protein
MSTKTARNIEETDPAVKPAIVTPTMPQAGNAKPTTPEDVVPAVDKNAPLRIEQIEEGEEDEPQDKSNKRLYSLGGLILILIILGVGGFIYFFINNQLDREGIVVPVVHESIQASPSAAFVRSKWSFEVLNGSGIPGISKKTADELTALGYKVVQIGNADKQTYKGNELFIDQEMESKVNLLITDLKGTVEIATVAGILSDSTASARIIVGR